MKRIFFVKTHHTTNYKMITQAKSIILSLGSSLGEKDKILSSAIKDINKIIGKVTSISKTYETEPWGFEDENIFHNLAIKISTKQQPETILKNIHQIEKKHHRTHTKTGYEARTLDIDIIFYENEIISTNELTIPHKYAHLRKFVLQPIMDIDKNIKHPTENKTIEELYYLCPDKTTIKPVNI